MTTMETADPIWLSCTDTAKLVRKTLKGAFPDSKFSVRSSSYSGGASIDVSWTDGPTVRAVDAVVGGFAGANFDGMIDMKFNSTAWLETDGTAHLAHTSGTAGSRGSYPERIESARTPGARLVRFGADFVQTHRELSDETKALLTAEIEAYTGEALEPNKSYPVATFGNRDLGGAGLATDTHGRGDYGSSLVWGLGARRDYSKRCDHFGFDTYGCGGGVHRCEGCGEVTPAKIL